MKRRKRKGNVMVGIVLDLIFWAAVGIMLAGLVV
jgi:hypothetical protein